MVLLNCLHYGTTSRGLITTRLSRSSAINSHLHCAMVCLVSFCLTLIFKYVHALHSLSYTTYLYRYVMHFWRDWIHVILSFFPVWVALRILLSGNLNVWSQSSLPSRLWCFTCCGVFYLFAVDKIFANLHVHLNVNSYCISLYTRVRWEFLVTVNFCNWFNFRRVI
jgi:hypothetical protein